MTDTPCCNAECWTQNCLWWLAALWPPLGSEASPRIVHCATGAEALLFAGGELHAPLIAAVMRWCMRATGNHRHHMSALLRLLSAGEASAAGSSCTSFAASSMLRVAPCLEITCTSRQNQDHDFQEITAPPHELTQPTTPPANQKVSNNLRDISCTDSMRPPTACEV
jgi:hypothetical protein